MSTSAYSSMWSNLSLGNGLNCVPNVSNMVDMSDPSIEILSFVLNRAGL